MAERGPPTGAVVDGFPHAQPQRRPTKVPRRQRKRPSALLTCGSRRRNWLRRFARALTRVGAGTPAQPLTSLSPQKYNKTSVVAEVKAKRAPKELDSGVPCARRVLEVVANSRGEAASALEDLLKALKDKLSKADKEDAIRSHVGELLKAKGEAEAEVDASAQDLAAAIEGCIITEVE